MRLAIQLRTPPLSSLRTSSWLCELAVLAILVHALGCDTKRSGQAPQTASQPPVEARPDDGQAVAVLQAARAKLKRNGGGTIEGIDLQAAGGGNAVLLAAAAKLPSLKSIVCTGPDVTSAAVAALAGHPSLERLLATDRSAIGDAGIEALVSVPNLTELTLERSEITDAAYANFAKMKKLKYLRANLTKTTDVGVEQLADSTQLEVLDFRDCAGVSDEGIMTLGKLTRIRSLKLWGRQITDKSLSVIGAMTNMSTLGLPDTAVTGAGGVLSGLAKLSDLDVFRSTFSDEGLKSIAGAQGIKSLKLRDCLVTAEGLKLLSGFVNLERLDLSESRADDSTLEAISGLTKLIELELWLSRVSDAGLVHIVQLPLKRLVLEDVYDISDVGMEHLGKIETLESLTLSKTSVTDDGLSQLAGLKNLTELYLDNTVVSQKGVEALKAKLPQLIKVRF